MIPKKQLTEIRNHLLKSENPLFFFDDDPDGLCSFLLFWKFIEKGHGIVVKSSPVLKEEFARKVEEYSPDKIFVLDKPIISEEFITKVNVPLIWIDHHTPIKLGGVRYYNPRIENPDEYTPTSEICYEVVKQNLWTAMIGMIGDWKIPKYIDGFSSQYPDLIKKTDEPGDVCYKMKFGKLIRIYSFLLKGKTSDVKKNINVLTRIESPYEILNQDTNRGKFLYKQFEKVKKEYDNLFKKAKANLGRGKFLVFTYPSTKMSFTGDLCNELSYRYSKKIVIVGREKEDEIRLSIRSKTCKLPEGLKKALEDVEGYGGGHEYAVGGNVKKKDFSRFVENLRKHLG